LTVLFLDLMNHLFKHLSQC